MRGLVIDSRPTPVTDRTVDELEAGQLDKLKKNAMRQDLEQFQDDRSAIDVRKCIVGGLAGGLVGVILGILIYNKTSVDIGNAFWGLLVGGCGGFAVTMMYYYVEARAYDSYFKEAEEKRNALRRFEMESIESHNEYVYYDAATQQGLLYRLLCCPHFGKITSERVIYSEYAPFEFQWTWESFGSWLMHFYRKKVESMDYDLVLDVSVEQSCHQYLTDTGTVVLHCEAAGDISTIKDEREKLISAMEKNNELQLKQCIQSAASIVVLAPLVKEAEIILTKVIQARKEDCAAKNIEFRHIFPHDTKDNSTKVVRVLDVSRPYMVLDDLSYKVCKETKLQTRQEILRRLATAGTGTLGDVFIGEEKL